MGEYKMGAACPHTPSPITRVMSEGAACAPSEGYGAGTAPFGMGEYKIV